MRLESSYLKHFLNYQKRGSIKNWLPLFREAFIKKKTFFCDKCHTGFFEGFPYAILWMFVIIFWQNERRTHPSQYVASDLVTTGLWTIIRLSQSEASTGVSWPMRGPQYLLQQRRDKWSIDMWTQKPLRQTVDCKFLVSLCCLSRDSNEISKLSQIQPISPCEISFIWGFLIRNPLNIPLADSYQEVADLLTTFNSADFIR